MTNIEQSKSDALKFLRENTTAVVATSFNDEPRASTVYYFMDDDFNFYFVTKRNTSKYIHAEANPRAAIVVGTGPEHITIQAFGKVELLVEDDQREKVLGHLMEIREREHITLWPIEELENFKDRNKVIFKISPAQVLFMNLDSKKYPDSISTEYAEIYAEK
jgi:nitroimidazol reductase NimA-like FMN-containing flavoprotein (pyridoxamine 5'-phosphate oxidase superfamily)